MTKPTENCFIFVVKTDMYAGNFEREMCAFMTGVVGECGVGDFSAKLFAEQTTADESWEDMLLQVSDEHGCYRPVSGWGDEFNDVAIFLREKPTPERIDFLRKRAMLFVSDRVGNSKFGSQFELIDGDKPIQILGFELIEYNVKVIASVISKFPPMEILEK